METFEIQERIKELLGRSSDLHDQFTPFELCDEMLDKIPELGVNQKILVMFNLEFLYKIKERIGTLDNVWFITPDEEVKKKATIMLGVNQNHIRIYSYKNKEVKELESMPKFDVVVGNPPYKKNLHLKMLELVHRYLNKDGHIIWIHPARWMQDLLALLKKGTDFLKYKDLSFIDFKIIPVGKASRLFSNEMTTDLVISHLKEGEKSILNEEKIYELRKIPISLRKILYKNTRSLQEVADKNMIDGIRVRMKIIVNSGNSGGSGIVPYLLYPYSEIIVNGLVDNKHWSESIPSNPYKKEKNSPIPLSIKFNTIKEAGNFINSTNTDFYLFLGYMTKLDVNVQLRYLPFMEDYKDSWGNERFQKYFGISDDDMKFIRKTIKFLKQNVR